MTTSPSEAVARLNDYADWLNSPSLDDPSPYDAMDGPNKEDDLRTALSLLEEARRVVEPFATLALPEDETGTLDDKIGQQKPLPYPVRQDAIRAGRAFLEKLGSET